MPLAKIATEASVRGVATSERMCAREEDEDEEEKEKGEMAGTKTILISSFGITPSFNYLSITCRTASAKSSDG